MTSVGGMYPSVMFLAAAIWLLNRGRGKIIIAVSHFADDSKTDGSEVAYGTREPHQVPNCLKFRCQSFFPFAIIID